MPESCGKSVPLLGPTSTCPANLLSSYRGCYLALSGISTFTTEDARFRETKLRGLESQHRFFLPGQPWRTMASHGDPKRSAGIGRTEQLPVANVTLVKYAVAFRCLGNLVIGQGTRRMRYA